MLVCIKGDLHGLHTRLTPPSSATLGVEIWSRVEKYHSVSFYICLKVYENLEGILRRGRRLVHGGGGRGAGGFDGVAGDSDWRDSFLYNMEGIAARLPGFEKYGSINIRNRSMDMRVGQNPAKYVKSVAKAERVTVAVLNYIPFVSGFYAEMPQVLKSCLDAIRQETTVPFDLMVFDNASCEEVQQYLLDERAAGHIQYLTLSEKNLGKGGAWNIMLSGAPGEVVAYMDNDCLVSKGWLARSLEILETYPNAGMVTSRPFRTQPEVYSSTLKWAQENPDVSVELGDIIPFEVFQEFDRSLAQTDEEIRQHYATSEDVLIEYEGVQAIIGASHWQFVARKNVLGEFLPFSMDRPMGQVKRLDQRMNDAGYLRLMPTEPLAMNMSNTLRTLPGMTSPTEGRKKKGSLYRLLDFPLIRKVLLAFYDLVFRWYYDRE
jgi:glycosyltransferase involved in cell wall biosynthesis